MAKPRTISYIALSSCLLVAYNATTPASALAAPPESDAEVEITAAAGVSSPPVAATPSAEASATAPATSGAPAAAIASAPPSAVVATSTSVDAKNATADAKPASAAETPTLSQKDAIKQDSPTSTNPFEVSAYVQSQLEIHQDSSDQLRQGGALLNQNRFLIRRGRLRVSKDWDYASIVVEFDGNTSKGASARLQKGEASLVYGRSKSKGMPPLLQLTAGLFDLPFGFEMTDSAKTRWFMERSIISRALFPGEPDVGMRLSGAAGFLRYSVAVTNGEPLDEKSGYGLQDPNANKDVTVRLGADVRATPIMGISGGISYNAGKGFHPGTDATKGTLTATDNDGNGVPETFTQSADKAATPSENFSRWALGADLQLRLKTGLGQTMLYGEVVAAQNLDRGLLIADPTIGDLNVREFGGYVGLTQEIAKYFVVGLRGDYYDPNADFLDKRAGKQVPTSMRVLGLSPMAGLVLPERARLLFQWDIQDNRFARDERGVPTRLKNNTAILRLQVNL